MRKYAYACVVFAALGSGASLAAEKPLQNVTERKDQAAASDTFTETRIAAVVPEQKEAGRGAIESTEIVPPEPKPATRPKPPSLVVSVNLSTQRMTVSEKGKVIHTWPISSGREGYRTPTGSYRPQWMSRMHYSKKYDNAPMPHSVFYHGGYAIHATYATGSLGRPASHGCIRLSPANAKTFYQLVEKHGKERTRISVHGVAPAAVAKARGNPQEVASGSNRSSPRKPSSTRRRPEAPQQVYRAGSDVYVWPGDEPPQRRLRYGSVSYGY